jgi:ribosome-associated toxin RatA of RatAB toxin-antitoxin module
MKRIARSAIVDCSAEAFYALVEDIESYPAFLPWCAAAAVRERTPGRTLATLTLAARSLRQTLTTENANHPGRSIEMRLVEGPFRRFSAHWHFTPLAPHAAKVEFAIEYEFSGHLVAGVLGPVFNRLADRTVEAFVRRAHARAVGSDAG